MTKKKRELTLRILEIQGHRMQTGLILLFFTFPMVLEGCCAINQDKLKVGAELSGLHQDVTHQHYRAVEGEHFMMPCIQSAGGCRNMLWSRAGNNRGGNDGPSFSFGRVEAKHTGKYKCLTRGGELFFHLQVVQKSRARCFQPETSDIELRSGSVGEIPCPAHNCTDNSDVTWYKENIPVSELSRKTCVMNGCLHLCGVREKYDEKVYFCDRKVIERGITWTVRRAVNVKVVPHRRQEPPWISYPVAKETEEVELDRSHNLTCDVFFPDEKHSSAKVQWYMNHGGNTNRRTLLDTERPTYQALIDEEYRVSQTTIIKTVTSQHLNHTFTCFASNTFGNISVTIKLEERVKWPSCVGYPVAFLLLAVGIAVILHLKSLELQIIYKSHFRCGNHGEKQFDVLLSHVWSSTSAEMETGWTLSFPSGRDTDDEACHQCVDLMKTKEGEAKQRPRAMLLHQVLEDQWGYRLCLLDRDVVPGGAYANDVVGAIQRSQMLICLLSADYLCDSNAVFVLESGIQALLQKSTPKLLLVWTCRASATLIQEAALPSLVQRALKVLPSLTWTTGEPELSTSCGFWRSLKKNMPDHSVKLESIM